MCIQVLSALRACRLVSKALQRGLSPLGGGAFGLYSCLKFESFLESFEVFFFFGRGVEGGSFQSFSERLKTQRRWLFMASTYLYFVP